MDSIELLGLPGSPYTRKMLALLRYRRIPHRMVWGTHFDPPPGYPSPKIKLLPTFYFSSPEGTEVVVDSTPIVQRLEAHYPQRSVTPQDPLLRFLDLLIEDFADEWLTKAMFHYRWHYAEDAAHAAAWLTFTQYPQMSAHQAQDMGHVFAQRQKSRLSLVGSSERTAPVIESSFQRLVGIMDGLIERQGFVLGARPASADFALYGQLTQLGMVDPTPMRWLEHHSPRLRAWLDRMEDLSGHAAEQWLHPSAVSSHLGELLGEIGRVYAPYLMANAKALSNNQSAFETTIDGHTWTQAVFAYQRKCLDTLREARDNLPAHTRQQLDALLQGTGCEVLFA